MTALAERLSQLKTSVPKANVGEKAPQLAIAKVMHPSGVFSANEGRQLQVDVYKVTTSGIQLVLVDFQAVTFMNSCGLGGLIAVFKQLRAVGGELYICGLNDQVRMLFELTGIDQVFKIFANAEQFHQAILENVVN
jgi:anti-sigma B factor antagonist